MGWQFAGHKAVFQDDVMNVFMGHESQPSQVKPEVSWQFFGIQRKYYYTMYFERCDFIQDKSKKNEFEEISSVAYFYR